MCEWADGTMEIDTFTDISKLAVDVYPDDRHFLDRSHNIITSGPACWRGSTVVSFMGRSLGLGMCYIILAIYFWRLMKCKLPTRDAIISCFVHVGPLNMAAYAIQKLAVGLAARILLPCELQRNHALLNLPVSVQTIGAIAESVHWLGIIVTFALLGLATFFLVEAFALIWAKSPRSFNIGF